MRIEEVTEVTEVTDALVEAFARLLPQLAPGLCAPRPVLEAVVAGPNTCLLVARGAGGALAGTLTLAWYRTPAVLRVWIEDVVVDEAARGQGVGEALVRAALERARALGATQVDLTSTPAREAANRLYQRLGFVRRDTNVYRYPF